MNNIKKILTVTSISISFFSCAQEKKEMLDSFSQKFQIENYPVKSNVFWSENATKIQVLNPDECSRLLNFNDSELINSNYCVSYDQDEDKGVYKELRYEVMALNQMKFENWTAFITSYVKTADYTGNGDTSFTHCTVLSREGKLFSKELIAIQPEHPDVSLWQEYVLIDSQNFKIFTYKTNLDIYLFDEKGNNTWKLKDKDGAKSICIITNYKIDNKGEINKLDEETPIYLKEEVIFYTLPPLIEVCRSF